MEFIVYMNLISAIVGGILASYKKDYFTRGFFICLFTSILGLIAIIISPESKAKQGDQDDYHAWPKYGSYAVLFLLFGSSLLLIISLIF